MVEEEKQEQAAGAGKGQGDKPKPAENALPKLPQNILVAAAAALVVGIFVGAAISAFIAQPADGMPADSAASQIQTMLSAEISSKAESYINENLLTESFIAQNTTATEYNSLLYKIEFEISDGEQSQQFSAFTTVDGKILFIGSGEFPGNYLAYDLDEPLPKPEEPEPVAYPKSDKPEVRLFVWSFCPGGVAGETALKPVVDLLGEKVDAKVVFIGPVTTDAEDAATSCFAGRGKTQEDALSNCCAVYPDIEGETVYSCALHNRADNLHESYESARQACIYKYFPDKFWGYVETFNANCLGSSDMDSCWGEQATALGIDREKIAGCAESAEGIKMLMGDSELSDEYDIHASPTLVINGVIYTGGTSAAGYKEAICSAFSETPSECLQQVSAGSNPSSDATCG